MKHRHFLKHLDEERITSAIREAEKKSSGKIRVLITHRKVNDPLASAEKHFHALKLHQSTERNSILIFLAPESQKFAVLGDENIHAKCGEETWNQLVEKMAVHFRKKEFTSGILEGIQSAGKLLEHHFPTNKDSLEQSGSEMIEED